MSSVHSSRGTAARHSEGMENDISTEEDEHIHQIKSDWRARQAEARQRPSVSAGCGGNHPRVVCKFKDAICWRCEQKGHIAKAFQASQPTYHRLRPLITQRQPHGSQPSFWKASFSKYKRGDDWPAEAREIHQTIVGHVDTYKSRKFHSIWILFVYRILDYHKESDSEFHQKAANTAEDPFKRPTRETHPSVGSSKYNSNNLWGHYR